MKGIIKKNHEALPLLCYDMLLEMLVILAFINAKPYKTFATYIAQSKEFFVKPKKFDVLASQISKGTYQDPSLQQNIIDVFSELEQIFESRGYKLYTDTIDHMTAQLLP